MQHTLGKDTQITPRGCPPPGGPQLQGQPSGRLANAGQPPPSRWRRGVDADGVVGTLARWNAGTQKRSPDACMPRGMPGVRATLYWQVPVGARSDAPCDDALHDGLQWNARSCALPKPGALPYYPTIVPCLASACPGFHLTPRAGLGGYAVTAPIELPS